MPRCSVARASELRPERCGRPAPKKALAREHCRGRMRGVSSAAVLGGSRSQVGSPVVKGPFDDGREHIGLISCGALQRRRPRKGPLCRHRRRARHEGGVLRLSPSLLAASVRRAHQRVLRRWLPKCMRFDPKPPAAHRSAGTTSTGGSAESVMGKRPPTSTLNSLANIGRASLDSEDPSFGDTSHQPTQQKAPR